MQHLFPQLAASADEPVAAPDPAAPAFYIRVAVERGIDSQGAGDGLTYRSPAPLEVGQRVEVPLGRGNQKSAGIVVARGGPELLDGLPAAKVKPILRADPARLPPKLVELARWMAGYYVCPLGMTLATMMPAAVKRSVGLQARTVLAPADPAAAAAILERERLPPSARSAWDAILALGPTQPLEPKDLAARISAPTLGPINRLTKLGLLVQSEVVRVRAKSPFWQSGRIGPSATVPPHLTHAQARVADGIGAALGSFSVHLLRGVTGSGKTEVYMQVLSRAIAAGRTGLILVPEIALTPQTAGRFIDRFSAAGEVAVLHSGLSASERHRQWALAASGRAAVVVGARSAVFAPVPRLGLIVVDEEHATDYKQDQLPRYSGRDVAIKRAQLEGCPVVLGSATPSLESWANATGAGSGRYKLWELTERVGNARLPRVEVVDLASERSAAPGQVRLLQSLSARLEEALRSVLAAGGQAILLLNRRGYSSYICCPSAACGWVMKCDHCDASMVLHRRVSGGAGELVRCHHCLAEQRTPRQCPACARRTISLGAGTQRLEEELAAKFPDLVQGRTMVRVDGDSMHGAKDYFSVLERFGRGEVRVLLGTQMIAKGLDFPGVRLVGVINADTALSIPDFRAAERTFQLVSQVAGRAGRGSEPGVVIVQTVNPREPAIAMAAEHDYVGFARAELRLRAAAGLPPAARMARIVVRDEDPARAAAAAAEVARRIAESPTPGLRVLGPAPCPISRIAGQFRHGLELIAPRASDLQAVLGRLRAAGALRSDAHMAVDVDPVALM